jgi:CRISPR system Cascade subunit CasB
VTETETAEPTVVGRVAIADLVATRVGALQARYLAGTSSGVADLAALRRAATQPVGADPRTWELALADVSPWARDDEATAAETAAHAAMTLYALHQQSRSQPMHRRGAGLGSAVRELGRATSAEAAVRRRFQALGTAATFTELMHHARSLVRQLRSAGVALDYGRLTRDLLDWQDPAKASAVRLRWGRDYHRVRVENADSQDTTTTDPTKE